MNLFENAPILLPLPDGEVQYDSTFLNLADADRYYHTLLQEIDWRQEQITIFGKQMDQPRLIAWHGDSGKSYSYSHLNLSPSPWTPTLIEIQNQLQTYTGIRFNSVLLNLYRTGTDSMGWHSDDEPELGPEPIIASISLGAIRRFRFRHRHDKQIPSQGIDLTPGSLLLMRGATQANWQHALPKTARTVSPRINLTYRVIQDGGTDSAVRVTE